MFALLRKSRVRSMLEQFLGSVGVEGPYVSCSCVRPALHSTSELSLISLNRVSPSLLDHHDRGSLLSL